MNLKSHTKSFLVSYPKCDRHKSYDLGRCQWSDWI